MGRQQESFRPLPSAECFESRNLSALQRNDGLIVNSEFAQFQRPAQISFEAQSLDGNSVHRVIKDLTARFPFPLGSIHRYLGIAYQIFRILYEVAQKAIPMLAVVTTSCPSTTKGMPNAPECARLREWRHRNP